MCKFIINLALLSLFLLLVACTSVSEEDAVTPFNPNVTLISLEISELTLNIPFQPDTARYTASAQNELAEVTFTPISTNSSFSITINGTAITSGTSSTVPLTEGKNVIEVSVAKDDAISTYVFTIIREPIPLRRFLNTETKLSSLVSSLGTLIPSFSSDIVTYSIVVDNSIENIFITTDFNALGTAKINNTSVSPGVVSDALPLNVGNNVLEILVTAENRATKKYTINVMRFEANSLKIFPLYTADLKNLLSSAGNFSPEFAANITDYTLNLDNADKFLQLAPIAADPASTVRVNTLVVASGSASTPLSLNVGNNRFDVLVTTPQNATKTYTINVTREPPLNTNTRLSALTISTGTLTPAFDRAITNYAVVLPFETTDISLTPALASAISIMTVNGESIASGQATDNIPLVVGNNNIINIEVLAVDASTQTYRIAITRQIENSGSVTDLSTLVITTDSTEQSLAANALTQTVSIPFDDTGLTVTPTLRDNTASVTVNGATIISSSASERISLAVGNNTITLVVTAADASTATYVIIANRASSSNLTNISLSFTFLEQPFQETQTSYTASVGYLAEGIRISGFLDDPAASMTVNGIATANSTESESIALIVGNNPIDLVVTAIDNTTKTYRIDVTRDDKNSVTQRHYVKAANSTGSSRDRNGPDYGVQTAISGSTLVVGAPREGNSAAGINGNRFYSCDIDFAIENCLPESGAVYVFTRTELTWVQQAYIKASTPGGNDQFGSSVDLEGDVLIIGAPFNGGGASYLYRRSNGVWVEETILKPQNLDSADEFGSAVAISGNTVVIGSPREDAPAVGVDDVDAEDDYGAAYVFVYENSTWVEQYYLKSSNPTQGDGFGSQVAIDGNIIAISATLEDSDAININGNENDNSSSNAGAVYLFQRTNNVWSKDAYIKAFNTDALSFFGSGLALSNNTLIVGSPGESGWGSGINSSTTAVGNSNSGAVYTYQRTTEGSWTTGDYIKSPNPSSDDNFGNNLALGGNNMVIGAYLEDSGLNFITTPDDNSLVDSGAAYFYKRVENNWLFSNYLKAPNADAGDQFGLGIATDGENISVGAPLEDGESSGIGGVIQGVDIGNAKPDAGAVYIFR